MKKINVAEILRNCPKGMELYSPIFGKVYLDKIRPHLAIVVTTDKEQGDFKEEFLYDGRYGMNGECMLFPSKGKTTWEGFVPPCKFKDGDVVAAGYSDSTQLFLLKHDVIYHKDGNVNTGYCYFGWDFYYNRLFEDGNWGFSRLATEEEKAKLFETIKANGYKWNSETKTLEKIVPKFKVGDRIRHIVGREEFATVVSVEELHYNLDSKVGTSSFSISLQHEWELVPNKFDINTLVPFESRVLVRDSDNGSWCPSFFGCCKKDNYLNCLTYNTIRGFYRQCIPYEGNEHLLGTTNDCIDFYKTWK